MKVPIIPEEFRRVDENRIDSMIGEHLSSPTALCKWMFARAFGACTVLAIESVRVHQYGDYRRVSDNKLAHGETDIEVVAKLMCACGPRRAGLLIENKVDATEMEQQGLRYRARAQYGVHSGKWQTCACVLVAPKSYLESHYPLGDFAEYGWDQLCSYEEIALRIPNAEQAKLILEATSAANAWNKPVPSAVQFWKNYSLFGRAHYSDVPVFVETQRGSRLGGVWPSFYDNQLRNNSNLPRRRRVQIVHLDTADYVSLFLKKVGFPQFSHAVSPLLEDYMRLARAGTSWQSIQIQVPRIDPLKGVEAQTDALDAVFQGARRFFHFYLQHEAAILGVPTNK